MVFPLFSVSLLISVVEREEIQRVNEQKDDYLVVCLGDALRVARTHTTIKLKNKERWKR